MRIPGGHAAWATIPALLRDRAATHRDSMHVEIAGRRLTIGEVDRLSDRVAAAFHAAGVRKGDRVCCFMSSSMEGLLTWMGAAKLGAIWAPLNSGLVGDDLAYTLDDAAACVLVVDRACRERVAALGDAIRLPALRLHTGEGEADGFRSFSTLFETAANPAPRVHLEPQDPAVILYTGGTTGMPKGVLLPHFAWIGSGYRIVEGFGLTGADRYYSVLPMFHVGGLMCGLPACILRSRAYGARSHPVRLWSPSTSTPSPPTAMSRATTPRSRRPRPLPTPPRSIAFWTGTAATGSRSATPRPCSGPMRRTWKPRPRPRPFSRVSWKAARRPMTKI